MIFGHHSIHCNRKIQSASLDTLRSIIGKSVTQNAKTDRELIISTTLPETARAHEEIMNGMFVTHLDGNAILIS